MLNFLIYNSMNHHEDKLTFKQRQQILNIAARIQPFYKKKQPGEEIVFLKFVRMCRDYCDPLVYNTVQGEERDRAFMERLKRFRTKYFEEV